MIVDAGCVTPEIKYSYLVIGSRQREAADCLDRMIWYRLRKRKAIFQRDIVNDYRLLVLPDPASDRTIHRDLFWRLPLCRRARFQKVAPHDVLRTIVKHHREAAKLEKHLQSTSEIMKQPR